MKRFSLSIVSLAFLFLTQFACKKDSAQPDVEVLLLNKNWKLTAFTINPAIPGSSGPTNDVLTGWDACEKDNLYIFQANGVFVSDEGATKCDPLAAQQKTSTWSYNKSTKLLTYCVGNGTACDRYSWTVSEINEAQFKGTGTENLNGTTYSYVVTFAKQ